MTSTTSALRDLDYPSLLLRRDAVDHNIAVMRAFCQSRGVDLCPHAKTSMSPEITAQQLAAGAWGLTAATPRQVRRLHEFGVPRILLANVLVDPGAIQWVAGVLLADPDRDFCCYVDSVAGVRLLERTLAELRPDRPMPVLVEVGYTGGRTGVRRLEQALEVSRLVRETRELTLLGVAGFEGLLPRAGKRLPPELVPFLTSLRTAAGTIRAESLFDTEAPVVSAGGSSYPDVVVDVLGPERFDFPVRTVLRSGCYVTHDHGVYERTSPFAGRAGAGAPRLRPALELVATVWSRPEDELVIAGFGRRDVPTDDILPVVLGRFDAVGRPLEADGFTVTGVNDQHGYVRVPATTSAAPGDRLTLGVGHPCGAFDRWRSVVVVDEGYGVVGHVTTAL